MQCSKVDACDQSLDAKRRCGEGIPLAIVNSWPV
jgi:hypothetical protein